MRIMLTKNYFYKYFFIDNFTKKANKTLDTPTPDCSYVKIILISRTYKRF